MKVSVVIPAYNEEGYIELCLKSLLEQEVLADEIIVVDNNSTDNTNKIATQLGAKVVKQPIQGRAYARNMGFDSAQYELIAKCDADTVVPKDWVKRIKADFESSDIDAMSGPVIFSGSLPRAISTLPSQFFLESLRILSKGNRYLLGANMAITKGMWDRVRDHVNMSDEDVHEDIDLAINIAKQGGKIGYDGAITVWTSDRRITKTPGTFLVEYPTRLLKTFLKNKK